MAFNELQRQQILRNSVPSMKETELRNNDPSVAEAYREYMAVKREMTQRKSEALDAISEEFSPILEEKWAQYEILLRLSM